MFQIAQLIRAVRNGNWTFGVLPDRQTGYAEIAGFLLGADEIRYDKTGVTDEIVKECAYNFPRRWHFHRTSR